jgi:hypothetical protein
MGNTILAHALYACSQAMFEPEEIFSIEGNSHNIADINQTELIAWHKDIHREENVVPILHVTCIDWDEVLRIKLSYSKWFLDVPTKNNFLKFGFTNPENDNWLENLTVKYWEMMQDAKKVSLTPELKLGDYISGDIDPLRIAVEQLGWQWNDKKSDIFYNEMLAHNNRYFKWLDLIKLTVEACLDKKEVKTNLEFWEQALVIARICDIKNISPSLLHWNDYGCFLNKNNVTLIKSLERI